jgi:phenylalanyl-tRNA synthetase beta chain
VKVSLNWLNDYIDLKGIPVEDIVHKLTMAGLEVEEVINENEIYKGFIVAHVTEKTKHPNADKLSLCKVNTGKEELQVICGAPNVEEGQKVVFAPIGTVIPNGNFQIKKAKIRGVESNGMICAEDELALSDDHSGIMILPAEYKEGTPVTEALGLNDVIMEVAITPNRPDALSHFGVARDLAAIYNKEFKIPEIKISETPEDINSAASVEIIDTVNCPRYSARIVCNVEIKESPEWLKNRLKKVGLRPISNIVDITNYVMYETGQPLHAFDLEEVSGSKIIIKSTEKEEKFITLDSKERILQPGTLMICDAEREVAVAGVMGGENSEISAKTKNILIESAYFKPSSIRRTSKKLGLSTEASYRFERGINHDGTVYSANRAAQLMAELGGGQILKGVIDAYPAALPEKEITLRFNQVKRILGYEVPARKIKDILEKLGFRILAKSDNDIKAAVPSFRPDIEREIDIIEEVARINGYDNIPTISKISISLGKRFDEAQFAENIKTTANALGFYEMINNPLVSSERASLTGNKIPLLNPQSVDMGYLRTSLLPGALDVVSRNIKYGEKNIALFETGNVFNKVSGAEIKSFEDFTEETDLIFILSGKSSEKEWFSEEKSYDFYAMKGLINSFCRKISLDNVLNDTYYFNGNTFFDYSLAKMYEGRVAGQGGRVRKDVLKKFDIAQDVYAFIFNINMLKSIQPGKKKYVEPLKYPKIQRDFAFIFDKEVTCDEVKEFIINSGSKLLKSVRLFDLFENAALGNTKKSLAFAMEYYSDERTLTDEEVEKEFLTLISLITKKFNATLRGS